MDEPFLSDGTNRGYANLNDEQMAFMAYLMRTYNAGDNVKRLQQALLEYLTDQSLALPTDKTVWGLIRHFYEEKNSPVWQGYVNYKKELSTKATNDDIQIQLKTKGKTRGVRTPTTTTTSDDIPPSPRRLLRSDSLWNAKPSEYTEADWRRDQEKEKSNLPDQRRDATQMIEETATETLTLRTGARLHIMPKDLKRR